MLRGMGEVKSSTHEEEGKLLMIVKLLYFDGEEHHKIDNYLVAL